MKRKRRKGRISTAGRMIACFLLSLILSSLGRGQGKLDRFSAESASRWQVERANAESLAHTLGIPVRIERDSVTIELQRFSGGRPQYYTTCNINAAISLGTDKLWPDGSSGFALTGATDTLAMWDAGGIRTTHLEFTGRVVTTEGATNFHSTHVAGTLISAGLRRAAHGMSPGAYLKSYDWNNDLAEMAGQAAQGLRISNHSYGLLTGWSYNALNDGNWVWFGDTSVSQTEDYRFGFYDDEARTWDSLACLAPYYLIVKAAGNDRGEGPTDTIWHWIFVGDSAKWVRAKRNVDGGQYGYDCLNGSGVSKNILAIGAVYDVQGGYSTPDSVWMTSFSSWGPADDGRVKPDLVANGTLLYSTYPYADNDYNYLTGTSMASPGVAGSVGLLLEYQKRLHGTTPLLASTLKALVLGTTDECGPSPGPDYMFGWGLMNTFHAVQLMQKDSIDGFGSHVIEQALFQSDTIRYRVYSDGLLPLRATLCWTDPAGVSPVPSLNPRIPVLVNDLDLRVIRGVEDSTSYPWKLDPDNPSAPAATGDNFVDNVEQVLIPAPARGLYTLQVSHKGTLEGGQQLFSLVVSGNVPSVGPSIALRPQSFAHILDTGATQIDTLVISSIGSDPLTFRLSDADSSGFPTWLSLGATSDTLATGEQFRIPVQIKTTGLPEGVYTTTILVASNDTLEPSVTVRILFHAGSNGNQLVNAQEGWNLLSVPLLPSDPRAKAEFPTAVSGAFYYHNGYVSAETLQAGKGYWLKFGSAESLGLYGSVILAETVNVETGWNMIGSISDPLAVSSIMSIPRGLLTSGFFGYSGSYARADTIYPGGGYWTKVSQPGQLVLVQNRFTADAGSRIRIVRSSELPPAPPETGREAGRNIPLEFALEQCYPNPFNPSTTIEYSLPEEANVSLVIFNVLGQDLSTLVSGYEGAGRKTVKFDGSNLPSGVYFYRIVADGFVQTRKMLLVR